MYVLFIPSFPNNRFRLGNIRTKKKQKEKKERKKKKQMLSLFVTNFAEILLLFLFYILWTTAKWAFQAGSVLHFHFCFLFFFFLFLFLVQTNKSRTFETGNGSDLRYSLFYCFLIAKKHVARLAGSFFLGHVLFPFPFFELWILSP